MQFCCARWTEATAWCESYDAVQTCAVVLLYVQVACALVGSLGAVYTGVVLANLALALFALVAIESGSQCLGRAYAGLLAFALLLDIVWFCLFTNEIRHFETQLGKAGAFSVKLMFWMQATGSGLRLISSFFWIQIYRLGAMAGTMGIYQPVDFERRIGILSPFSSGYPTPTSKTQYFSTSSDILGGSIYDPAAYASVCERLSDDTYHDDEVI